VERERRKWMGWKGNEERGGGGWGGRGKEEKGTGLKG